MSKSNYLKIASAVFLVFLILFSGCSGLYSNVMTRYKDAPICCQSPGYFSYEELKTGDSKIIDLNENSPAFQFDTGKSYFKAYSLPPYAGPYKVSVQSYMRGQYIETAYIFVPKLIFLNEKYEVVRATDPRDFRLERADFSETWGLRFKIVGSIDVSQENMNEKFFIVMTTEELLQGKTSITVPRTIPIPLAGSMLPIPAGEKSVSVPNAPVGRIKIALMAGSPSNNEFPSGKVPGKSIASSNAQMHMSLSVMNWESLEDNTCKQSKIIDTEVVEYPKDQNRDSWNEKWTVDRCGKLVYYKILITPSPSGGTYMVTHWK